jgi:hypothetical protein
VDLEMEDFIKSMGMDRYDRNARLKPALLVLLPLLSVVVIWFPQVWTIFGTLVALAASCGLTLLLAQLARQRGRDLEHKLGDKIGRRHSARLLSFTDETLSATTKGRYHAYLAQHGHALPSHDGELKDPEGAADQRRSAIDWLLEHTRANAKASMLLDENIAYGFRRNLLGLKPVAIASLVFANAGNALCLILLPTPSALFWSGVFLQVMLLLALVVWVRYVSEKFVEDASLSYAQRLLAQCELATGQPRKSANRRIRVL